MVRYAGKRLTAKKIAKVIDSIPHEVYVEPFAGLATVMRYKKPSKIHIVNDISCKTIRVAKKVNPAMKQATVLCGHDYKEIIKKYDSPKTLFYLDPPYEGIDKFPYESNPEALKKIGRSPQMKYATNVPLKEVLSACESVQGKCLLSYSPKYKKQICSGKLKCKTIPFNFWGHKRFDILAIKA